MSFTLYDASIVMAKDALNSLKAILKKSEELPNAASFPEARIHGDMFPLTFQVFFTIEIANKLAARLTGAEPKSFENNLKSFNDMYERIDEVLKTLDGVDKSVVDSRVDSIVTVNLSPDRTADMSSKAYVQGYAIPNIFFHLSTAYAILRKEGVPIGKMDYLTPFISKHVSM